MLQKTSVWGEKRSLCLFSFFFKLFVLSYTFSSLSFLSPLPMPLICFRCLLKRGPSENEQEVKGSTIGEALRSQLSHTTLCQAHLPA